MSTNPARLEARVSAQERLQIMLNARIEELSQDMNTSFKQLADYQVETENKIEARFNHLDARLDRVEATMATKEDLAAMESRMIDRNEAMEGRILDAFKQLLTMINPPNPPSQ